MIIPNHPRLLRTLTANTDLAFEFFFAFSRAEYALKKAGCIVGKDGRLRADWDGFAERIQREFDPGATRDLAQAISYLRANPPRKQVRQNGTLRWIPLTRSENGVRWLLRLTQTVRNNLFHGGKFDQGDDPVRNANLLRNCLILLDACIRVDRRVYDYYWGRRS